MGLRPFTRAFEIKLELADDAAWNHGLYVRLATASVMSRDVKYPKKPLMKTARLEKDPKYNMHEIQNRFLTQMAKINSGFPKKEVENV